MSNQFELAMKLLLNNAGARESVKQISRDMKTVTQSVKEQWSDVSQSIQKRLALIGFGAGAGKILYDSARIDNSLSRIGNAAGVSREKIVRLKNDIFTASERSGKSVDTLAENFASLQKYMSWDSAGEAFKPIDDAADLTGANFEGLTQSVTKLKSAFKDDSNAGSITTILDKLYDAGSGAGGMEALAASVAKVSSAASGLNMSFDETTGLIRALYSIEPNQERTTSMAENMLKMFSSPEWSRQMQANGLKLFNADGTRRDVIAVLADIKKRFGGLSNELQRANFVSRIFTGAEQETKRAMAVILNSDVLEKAANYRSTDSQGLIQKKLKDMSENDPQTQALRFKNMMRRVADDIASPINKAGAGALGYLMDKQGFSGTDMLIGGGVLSVAGSILGKRMGGALGGWLSGKAGLMPAVATGKALQESTGVDPVYVVNAAEIGAASGNGLGGGIAARLLGGAGLAGLGPAVAAIALVAGGMYATYKVNQKNISDALDINAAREAKKPRTGYQSWADLKRNEEYGSEWDRMQYQNARMTEWSTKRQAEYERNHGIVPIESNVTIILPESGTIVTKSDGKHKVHARVERSPHNPMALQ